MKSIKFKNHKIQNGVIRPAQKKDITQLLRLENQSFNHDQMDRRSMLWMISKAHSLFAVIEENKEIVGYGLVLFKKGTSLARLYSISLAPKARGRGLSKKLLKLLEDVAALEDCAFMRLEVKESNHVAKKLYQKMGYVKFSVKKNYYEDGSNAFCFEKRIRYLHSKPRKDIPYYEQNTEFTCGPSCLLMGMKALNKNIKMNLSQELQIWREATTIFMSSGHGGCGPRGLALAAHKRGFKVELYVSSEGSVFIDSVRNESKKSIVKLVFTDFCNKIKKNKIKVNSKKFTIPKLKKILDRDGVVIMLITTYHFDNRKIPHWVIVTAYDDQFIYLHDPDYDSENEKFGENYRKHIPITYDQFRRISIWGKTRYSSAVVLYER